MNVPALIENLILQHGYELIEAEFVRARNLWRVFIDRPESKSGVDLISVDDCSRVTELLLDEFEAKNVAYDYLEVSSPGIDRALTKLNHFARFAGEQVKLTLEPAYQGERKLNGELLGATAQEVRIRNEDGEHVIPYANVARARVVAQI